MVAEIFLTSKQIPIQIHLHTEDVQHIFHLHESFGLAGDILPPVPPPPRPLWKQPPSHNSETIVFLDVTPQRFPGWFLTSSSR